MTLHSSSRPLLGSKITDIKKEDGLAPGDVFDVAGTPPTSQARFLGSAASAPVFTGVPTGLQIFNRSPGDDEDPTVGAIDVSLVLEGAPGFPNGIQLSKASIPGGSGTLIDPFGEIELFIFTAIKTLVWDHRERLVIKVNSFEPTFELLCIQATWNDFSSETVRVARTQLQDVTDGDMSKLERIIPEPPTGRIYMPVHGGFISFSSGSTWANPSDLETLTAVPFLKVNEPAPPTLDNLLPRAFNQPVPPDGSFTIAGLDTIVKPGQSIMAGQINDPDPAEDTIVALTTYLDLNASNLSE